MQEALRIQQEEEERLRREAEERERRIEEALRANLLEEKVGTGYRRHCKPRRRRLVQDTEGTVSQGVEG